MAAFSEAEWAAILPLRTAEEDGAGAVKLGSRAWTLSPTPPLPPGGASDLSSFPALARNAQVDAAFVTRPAQRLLAVCQITMLGCMAALLAFAWLANAALDSPRYSTTALATGCAVFIFDAIGTFAVFVVYAAIARQPRICSYALEATAAWRRLVDEEPSSALIIHRAGDQACPCPAPNCAGLFPGLATRFWIPGVLLFVAWANVATVLFSVWSPLVIFGPQMWGSPWAIVAALCLLSGTVGNLRMVLATHLGYPALVALANRVQIRAVAILLSDDVDRLRQRAVGIAERKPDLAETFPQRPTDGHLAAASYIHSRLSERWTSAAADVSRSRVVLSLLFGVWVVDCIVYASVSGCIPAWPLASATCVVITLFLDLAMVATINSGPERASKLYTDAAVAASEWALAARRMGDTELAAEASDFASVARGYAGISAARARMFGVPVDWSLLGRLVVTGMTVVIGMWTLLRGAGVVFVLDTFCPLQA